MNVRLKTRILDRFGSQIRFAFEMKEQESVVSKAVRGWLALSPDKQRKWAEALGCRVEDIFTNQEG